MENIDISAMFIATEVREYVIAEYYANMLAELQHAAKRFDYFFAKSDATPFLPTVLIDHLAWRMDHSRVHYLNPKITSDRLNRWVSESVRDGYAQGFLMSMLQALAALGISLQEGPQAVALVKAEETRQQEQRDEVKRIMENFMKELKFDEDAQIVGDQ